MTHRVKSNVFLQRFLPTAKLPRKRGFSRSRNKKSRAFLHQLMQKCTGIKKKESDLRAGTPDERRRKYTMKLRGLGALALQIGKIKR